MMTDQSVDAMQDNHVGMTHVNGTLILVPWCLFLGAIVYSLITENLLVFAAFSVIGGIPAILVYCRDNIRNPRQIDIQEDGFLAVYRNGKSEFISWERINAISYYPADPTKLGRKNVMSAYQLKGKAYITLLRTS